MADAPTNRAPFITGSHAYGDPRPDSDIDLVVWAVGPTRKILEAGGYPVRFGSLNLILISDADQWDIWQRGTEAAGNAVQVREGREYVRGDKMVVGPATPNSPNSPYFKTHPWRVGEQLYTDDGRFSSAPGVMTPDLDLIAEVAHPADQALVRSLADELSQAHKTNASLRRRLYAATTAQKPIAESATVAAPPLQVREVNLGDDDIIKDGDKYIDRHSLTVCDCVNTLGMSVSQARSWYKFIGRVYRLIAEVPEPPFQDGASVRCLRASPQVNPQGEAMDMCHCIKDNDYTIDRCVWSPVGWLVSITGELHKAADFAEVPEPAKEVGVGETEIQRVVREHLSSDEEVDELFIDELCNLETLLDRISRHVNGLPITGEKACRECLREARKINHMLRAVVDAFTEFTPAPPTETPDDSEWRTIEPKDVRVGDQCKIRGAGGQWRDVETVLADGSYGERWEFRRRRQPSHRAFASAEEAMVGKRCALSNDPEFRLTKYAVLLADLGDAFRLRFIVAGDAFDEIKRYSYCRIDSPCGVEVKR